MRLIVVFFIASLCFGQSQLLQQYLNLTDSQLAGIAKLNSDYYSYSSARQQRVYELNNELSALYSKPAPDPVQLGIRYVELESILRDLAARLSTLQTQLTTQLSAAQTAAVESLNAAAVAQPLISDALCGFLLNGVASPWFDTSTFATGALQVPAVSFCGSTLFPASVRLFLGLTNAQIAVIFNANADYSDYAARKQYRMADLYVEIRDETAKPSPNALALGVRYVELDTIQKDLQSEATRLRQAARAVLTTAQAAQLQTLQSQAAQQPLVYEAQSLNLLVLAPGSGGNTVRPNAVNVYSPVLDVVPFPDATPSLTQYLNLSAQQVAALRKQNGDYQIYLSTGQARINTVNNELASLYANPPLDANQVGLRYVELEAIRRDMAAHLAALQSQDAAQLTKAQSASIQTLYDASNLQPLASDAQCGFLIDQLPFGGIFGGIPGGIPTAAYRTGDFASFLLGDPGTAFPYIPPAPSATFCGLPTLPISVRVYLGLTDAQVAAIFNQNAAYNDYYARRQNRIADVSLEIRDETAKPTPDALALGLRYSELQAIGQEIQAMNLQLRQAARNALSASQAAQLKALQDSANLQPLTLEAQGCNLLVPSLSTVYFVYAGRLGCPL